MRLVVNYDLPKLASVYIHRVGRTARAGRTGHALTLVREGQTGLFRKMRKSIGLSSNSNSSNGGGGGVVSNLLRSRPALLTAHSVKPAYRLALTGLGAVLKKEEEGQLLPWQPLDA